MQALLWPHLRPQLGAFSVALALALLIAALSAAQPLLTRMVIDQGLIGRQFPRWSRPASACWDSRWLASCWAACIGSIYVRASGRALFSLRGAVYAHLLRVSPRRLARVPVGDLVSRLDGDIAEVQRFGTDAAASFISSVLTLGCRRRGDAGTLVAVDLAGRGLAAAAAAGASVCAAAHRGEYARIA